MRIIVIAPQESGLSGALAAHLHLDLVHVPAEITGDGFVLDGGPRDVAEAHALDAVLRARGAEVTAVLWLRGEPLTPRAEAVLDHYRGRIVELDGTGVAVEAALDGLREALLAA